MDVRPALPSDLARLDPLYAERQTIVTQADPRLPPLPGAPAWLGRGAHGQVWVGGEPVGGYLSLWLGQWPAGGLPHQTGLIDHMALDAHAYYPGLGRALYAAAHSWLAERGAAEVLALVPRYDPVAQAFWRTLGAHPHPTPPLSLVGYQVLTKPLTP
jgi:GNAT superfamily N-acetyltransferase